VLQRGPCCGMVALHMALAQIRLNWELRTTKHCGSICDDEIESKGDEENVHRDKDNDNEEDIDDDENEENSNYKIENLSQELNKSEGNIPSVEAIVDAAKANNFTAFGEMFSCDNMAHLARNFLPRSSSVSVRRFGKEEDDDSDSDKAKKFESVVKAFKRHFHAGGLILIPYDKDVNFSPYMGGGKKAHWALLLGLVEVFVAGTTAMVEDEEGEEYMTGIEKNMSSLKIKIESSKRIHLIAARHGKSLRIAFWKLKDLLKSNGQLMNYDLEKLERDDGPMKPVVPEGGLVEGLKGRMVFVNP